MKRLATLSCLLVCLATHQARGQTKVTITDTEVAGNTVVGAGTIKIGKDVVPVGANVFLRDKKTKKEIAGSEFLAAPLNAGKVSFFTATWSSVPDGDYEMVIVVTVIKGTEMEKHEGRFPVTVKKKK